ncbi:hypothetical protein C8J56DRAFT_886921 [Mycena floridula]|nr:hypothetical protein C8J56DRAFT_886921 [Mycena floridula]
MTPGNLEILVNERYLLNANASENHRVAKSFPSLNRQYVLLRKYFQRGPLPTGFDVNGLTVLDVGAGSLAWTMDVAQRNVSAKVRFYACDIVPDNFPEQSITESLEIITFLHDATKPFSVKMEGMVDLVNMRLLTYALSEEQWRATLNNVHKVLKPQGHLLLCEPDMVHWTCEEAIAGARIPGTWMSPYNKMFQRHSEAVGFIENASEKLPELLRDASFEIKDQVTEKLPMGMACKIFGCINGVLLDHDS